MEKLSLTSSVGVNPTFAGAPISHRRSACQPFFLPAFQRGRLATVRHKRFFVSAVKSNRTDSASSRNLSKNVFERLKFQGFASVSSSGSDKVSTGMVTAPPVPPPPSYIGTPLFWVGVGVALSALFSVVVSKLKQYALQQAFKTMMNQSGAPQGSGPFTSPAFPGGAPFPFPTMPPQGAPGPANFPPPPAVQERKESAVTVDVSTTKVEAPPPPPPKSSDEKIEERDQKKFAFVDVSPEKKEVEYPPEPEKDASGTIEPEIVGSTNGAAFKTSDAGPNQQSQSQYQSQSQPSAGAPFLSVDALEKMMEDPTVQQMVYPYLPEEMRNPSTFKWMLQNPQYRQQLQDMLNNMGGGNSEWDSRMMDSLKNFDLSSPEVKQQFEQIGLTPQEVINKIMANPEVAAAFQNPRIQAAIMDCSQNPFNISKYQNDKEVMDVFNKIAELFPGVTAPLGKF